MNRKEHWENIYANKALNEVSWYQPNPELALQLIEQYCTDKNAAIIDVGGGDSFLVDHLLEAGFTNITVLDISQKAIERAHVRLGNKAEKVNWVVSDIVDYTPNQTFDIWYDRAAFHFLTQDKEVQQYENTVNAAVPQNGTVIIGTFSENGPLKCSGIEIKQYAKEDFLSLFAKRFELVDFINTDHDTPFDTVQNFNFAVLQKRKA